MAASTVRDGGWAAPDGRLGAQLVSSLARRPPAVRRGRTPLRAVADRPCRRSKPSSPRWREPTRWSLSARRPAASRNGRPDPLLRSTSVPPGRRCRVFQRPTEAQMRCQGMAPSRSEKTVAIPIAPDASRSCDQVFRVPQLLLRPSAPGVRQRDGTSDRHALQRRFPTVNRNLPDLTGLGRECGLTISRPRTS